MGGGLGVVVTIVRILGYDCVIAGWEKIAINGKADFEWEGEEGEGLFFLLLVLFWF